MRFIIRNVNIVNVHQIEREMDVLIEDGRISAIQPALSSVYEQPVFDGTGLWLFPAFADVYCHLREIGFTHRDDLAAGARNAAGGGYAAICCMPNTKPVLDRTVLLRDVCRQAESAVIPIYPIAAISHGMKGTRLTDFAKLHQAGAIAFSDDAMPIRDDDLMKRAMNASAATACPVLTRADLAASFASNASLLRDMNLAEGSGGRLHICQLQSKAAVQAIAEAKQRSRRGRITCDTSPSVFSGLPAVPTPGDRRTPKEEDRRAVLRAIVDGTIDAIVTDARWNEPSDGDEQQLTVFSRMFSAVVTELYQPGLVSPTRLAELLSVNPRRILNLKGGRIAKGEPADIVLCDLDTPYTATQQGSAKPAYGRVLMTLCGGSVAYDASDQSTDFTKD